MKKEKSCGCIILNNNKVLLVFEKNSKFWGFPKGHMENNETEVETAKRECKEEVGLDVIIDSSKSYSINYVVNSKIDKNVVFFLASVNDDKVVIQEEEIEKYIWCDYMEALKLLTYHDLKNVFKKALNDIGVLYEK